MRSALLASTTLLLGTLLTLPLVHADTLTPSDNGITLSPAVAALIEQANAGDADAANTLGFQYGNGLSVMQNDTESLKWYHKAAELGSFDAEYQLSTAYRDGFGVKEDDVEAIKWLRKAADHGLDKAQNSLGYRYETGEEVKQDYQQAADWYSKAAAQGMKAAQDNLQDLRDRKLLQK